MQVLSATTLNVTGCATGTAGVTQFGEVQPGAKLTTSADCTVIFGSNNDTSQLRLVQADRDGAAMWGGQADGSLETSFASGVGWLTDSFVAGSHETTYDLAVQPDMQVLAAGRAWFAGGQDFSLSRLNPDGSRDTGFGTGGNVRLDIDGRDIARAVAVEADGHILVAGNSNTADEQLTVARFTAAGVLDTAWGTGGYVRYNLRAAGVVEEPRDMLVQPDGRIVIVGRIDTDGNVTADGFAARLLADGSLDASFGVGGIREIDVQATQDELWQVRQQPDGKLVMVGFTRHMPNGRDNMLAVRLTTTGAYDPTFDGDGIVSHDRDGTGNDWDKAFGMALQDNGRIVLSGATNTGLSDDKAAFVRLLANGAVDPSFGVAGQLIVDSTAQDDDAVRIDVLPDGSLASSGAAIVADTTVVQTWRVTPLGEFDTSYSGDGYAPITIGGGSTAVHVHAQAVHADGSLLVSGESKNAGNDMDYLYARFDATPIPDYAAGSWGTSTPLFGACLRDKANATATWAVDGNADCTSVDTDPWTPIARTSADPTAEIARTTLGVNNASVSLRFGMLVSPTQRQGGLVAPLSFEIVAPA